MSLKNLCKRKLKHFSILGSFLLFSTVAFAQKTVTGTVIDNAGLPLPGANVIEKGTKNGVSTDFDGKFKLTVADSKSIVVFSSIGYETVSLTVGKNKIMNIIMKAAENKLEEVVIGYGTSKKADLTGSVATVSGNDLAKKNMSSVTEALTGKIAGVQIASAEGSPDAQMNIRIRGAGSFATDSAPLFIVDGFPVSSISDISSSDIESMTILKDASSTAIYGSRGANGVIIITTKKGGKDGGKVAVNFNRSYGFKSIVKTHDVLNPQDYASWQYEYGLLNNKTIATYYDIPFGGSWYPGQFQGVQGRNWQKEIYGRNAAVAYTDLGIRGGSEKLNFNLNFARVDEEAIMIGSNYKRDNISANLRSKASDKIDISFTLRYSDTQIDGGGANDVNEKSTQDSRFRHAMGYSPIPLTGITTDDIDDLSAATTYNISPEVAVADNNRYQDRKNYNVSGSFQWKMTNNLTYKTDFGFDSYFIGDNRFYGRSTYFVNNNVGLDNGLAALERLNRKDVKLRNSNTVTYDFKKTLGEKHKLKILFGEETLTQSRTDDFSLLTGFPKSFTFDNTIALTGQAKTAKINNFIFAEDNTLSFFGRLNYDINNRYLLTATFRADGSNKFLGNNKWGYFPSAALAWKISEESFLKNVSWIKGLKLRVSYGEAGNNNIPVNQASEKQLLESPIILPWINNITSVFAPTDTMVNPDLKWETTVTQNIGLDYELFKGKLNGSIEYYKNVTKDLLIKFPISGGYNFQYRNMGDLQNTGIETTINYIAVDKDNYGLDFNFNIAFNENRINSLGVMNNYGATTGWASSSIGIDYIANVGEPIGQMYGYVSAGRYEVSDFNFAGGVYTLKPGVPNAGSIIGTTIRPGSMKLADINGDGLITTADQKVIGNSNPVHTGGITLNANAYGFDLSAAFNWTYGNDIYNADKIHATTSIDNPSYRNLNSTMESGVRWNNLDSTTGLLVTNPSQLQAMNANTTMWSPNMGRYMLTDWAVEDGSFLRLNTLTLGYSLKKDVISKINLSKLRLYITANNVFVWTKYSGLDPEVSTKRATPLTPGVDHSAYPRSRQFVLGLNVNF